LLLLLLLLLLLFDSRQSAMSGSAAPLYRLMWGSIQSPSKEASTSEHMKAGYWTDRRDIT